MAAAEQDCCQFFEFAITVDPGLPSRMRTDAKRLQQVLKNLLSNAFKFTHQGSVTLTMDAVAKTFRYLDEEELAKQRKAAKDAKDKAKK